MSPQWVGYSISSMVWFAQRVGVTATGDYVWVLYAASMLGMWVPPAVPHYLLVWHRLVVPATLLTGFIFLNVRAEFTASVEDAHALYLVRGSSFSQFSSSAVWESTHYVDSVSLAALRDVVVATDAVVATNDRVQVPLRGRVVAGALDSSNQCVRIGRSFHCHGVTLAIRARLRDAGDAFEGVFDGPFTVSAGHPFDGDLLSHVRITLPGRRSCTFPV